MNTALILAAHGSSRNREINRSLFGLAESISHQLDQVLVTPAFLDGEPDVRSIIEEIPNRDVLVVPFMASQGYYTDVVFPRALHHEKKFIRFAKAIGAHADLANMVENRVREIESRIGWDHYSIVVVGHGTRKNKASCRTTIDLSHQLRRRLDRSRIRFAFIDQNPSMEHVVKNLDTSHVVVVPFLMGLGPHTTKDVPAAFGFSNFENQLADESCQFPIVQNIESGLRPDNSVIREVAFDAPVGTYPSMANLCVKIYREHQSQLNIAEGVA